LFSTFRRIAIIVLLIVSTLAALAAADTEAVGVEYNHGNGRPACRTSEELGRKWRNNWDPQRYWVCHGNQAVSYVCPTEHLFFEKAQCCIHWFYWYHTTPRDPPTLSESRRR
jgi:hypothetical protein